MFSHSIWRFAPAATVVLVMACACLPTTAQKQVWNWYFGNRAGITFRNGQAEVLSDGMMSTPKGCASQSDRATGELLFYTDGITIWNRLHEVMPNGTGLHGDATTSQGVIIVPMPGSQYVYYVFNAAPVSAPSLDGRCLCLTYSIVDMRRENGFGDVVQKNIVVVDDITEHITATSRCDDGTFWIVVRSRSSRHFLSFHLSDAGLVTTPVVSDASNPQLVIRSGGQMHISPNGRRLVITSVSGNSQLYNFSPSSGKVTSGINLFPDDVQGVHYGAAFSADNKYVYIAVSNRSRIPNELFRFRTDMPSAAATVTSRQFVRGGFGLVPTPLPLQLAPDSAIYIGRPGEPILSSITRASNVNLDSIRIIDTAIVLTGRSQSGLPNVIGSSLFTQKGTPACDVPRASFAVPTTCAGGCVSFLDESMGSITTWQWTFEGADPPSSTLRSPSRVCYARPGTYRVRLVVSNDDGADTMDRSITIMPPPTLDVTKEVVACSGSPVRLSVTGAETYRWYPASTLDDPTSATPLARPTATTRYTVIGTSVNGCVDSATVLVRIPQMQAGADVAICRGDTVRLRADGALAYQWAPADGLDDPRSAVPLATPKATTAYTVTMTSGECIEVDTVVVTVVDSVHVAISAPASVCAGDTVTVEAVGSAGQVWWSPASAVSDATARQPRVVVNERTVLTVTATSGSCTATDSVVIDVMQRPSITAIGNATICPGNSAQLRVITAAANVRWTPTVGLDDPSSRTPVVVPQQTTTYHVEAFDDEACVSSDSVTVIVIDMVKVSAGIDKSICRGDAVQLAGIGPSNATYAWSPTTGLDDPTSLSPLASPAVTTTYVLTIDAGTCILKDSMTVHVSSLDISVSSDTTICRGSGIELRADGGASRFTWIPSDGLSDPTISNPVASPSVTTTYMVLAEDQFGCRDQARVTVTVRDTVPLRLRLGSVTAKAGEDLVNIPIFVEADPNLLPIQIDELRAEINSDLTVFMPRSAERGDVVIGRTSDERRITILTLQDVQLLSPSQRLTTITGQVLLGNEVFTPFVWENVSWKGEFCPTVSTQNGTLYVSGCFIQGRLIKYFGEASFRLMQRPNDGMVDIIISGSEPGLHVARIISTQGKVVWEGSVHRPRGDARELTLTADLTGLGSGSYFVQLLEPFGSQTMGMTLLR
ncbi:MAG: PKD domain-containing protein [Candidatus Kapabacteria bacterium]|nr:PKD domain-containing protein [Candidatus Kapabacteria bacterium]